MSVSEIGAELELVIAVDFGPVGHPLKLLFALGQRAVAARHAKAIAEVKGRPSEIAAVARRCRRRLVQDEATPTRGFQCLRSSLVGVRNSDGGHRCSSNIRLRRHRVVLEVTEAEISEQRSAEGLGDTRRETVVVSNRASGEAAGPEADASKCSVGAFAGDVEVIETEAAKDVDGWLGCKVDAGIKTVLFVGARSGRDEVVEYLRIRRRGEQGQDGTSLGGNIADGNLIVDITNIPPT